MAAISSYKYILVLCAAIILSGCVKKAAINTAEKEKKIGETYFQAGTNELSNGNFTAALRAFLKANEYLDDDPRVWTNMALSYYGKRNFIKAEESLLKALKIDKKFSEARNNLALLYFRQKKYTKARSELEIVLKDMLYYDQFKTHYNLALIDFAENKLSSSKARLEASIKENKNHCPAWLKLAEVSWILSDKSNSLDALDKATSGLCYGYVQAHYKLGNYFIKVDDIESAKEKFLEIKTRFPNSKWATKANKKLLSLRDKY